MVALGGTGAGADAADHRSGRAARRGQLDPAERQPGFLRRTGAVYAHAGRIRQDADRSAPGQRSAKIRHAAGLHRSAPRSGHDAGLASGRQAEAELDRGERDRAEPRLRSQARSHPGHHRRLRHARGQAHRVAGAQRKNAANENRGCARKRPRAGGISRPRRALWIQPRRSAHRFGRRACRPTIAFRSRWSAPIRAKSCSSTTAGVRNAAAVFTAPRSTPRRTPRFSWKCCGRNRPPTSPLSHYAFVVLSDLGSLPAGARRFSAELRDRRRIGADRAGTRFGRDAQSSGHRRTHPDIHATPAAKASASSPSPTSMPGIPCCTAWSDSQA